jgi:hypothetical protein
MQRCTPIGHPERSRARWTRQARALVLAMLIARGAAAQAGPAISLRVHPKAGDTLHTRFEHDVVMSGTTKVRGRDTTLRSSSSLLVLARLAVQSCDATGCTVAVITDSVALLAVDAQALAPSEAARRAMQGRRFQLRVRPDGSTLVLTAAKGIEPELGPFVDAMPTVLPARDVAVGATWESAADVPVGGDAGARHGARLKVRYRLDSLSAGDALAFLSLSGVVVRDSLEAPVRGGSRMGAHGDVSGTLALDRTRGWWRDSRLTIVLRSVVTPPPGNDAPPVHLETRITQHLQTEANH